MSIDLDKHRNAILQAFNDVVNDKTQTNWALYGYEGQTNVLKLIGTGEDGVEEMAEDLNSSKIMYAILRITDPNTTRPKIVLINWQGEGAPTLRKGTCARHLNDVKKVLSGAHVTVNARTEEEVEPEVIMESILKASATTYNFNERSEISDKTTPVPKPSGPAVTCGDGSKTYPSKKPKPKIKVDLGTNYKRTNPLAEINTKSRNRFWEEQEAEEKQRKTEEQSRRDKESQLLETERKQREISDAKHRDVLSKERNARIYAERKAEEDAAKRLQAQEDKKWQADLHTQYQEEQERAKRAEMMRLERKKEAESLIGHRTHSTRALFESATTTSQQSTDINRPPPRKLKEFKPANCNERVENNENAAVIPTRGVTARWPPAITTAQNDDTSPNQNKDQVTASSTNRTQVHVTSSSSSAVPKTQQTHSIPAQHHIPQQTVPQHVPQQTVPQHHVPQQPVPQQPVPQQHVPQQPVPQQTVPQQQIPQQQLPHRTVTQPVQPQAVPPQAVQPESVERQSSQPQSNGDVSSSIYDTTVVPNKTAIENEYQVYENDDQVYDSTICSTSDETVQNNVVTEPAYNSTTPAIGMVYEVDVDATGYAQSFDYGYTGVPYQTYQGMEYQILPEHGLCARALYDYQAADDTEITFDPEEIITNIDQIDAGWWQGVGPDGTFGLFPANYVELINQSSV